MKIKGAILDVDGVLLDSMVIWRNAAPRFLSSLGKIPALLLWKDLYDLTMEEGAVYLREKYDLSLSEEEIIEGILGVIESFYREEVELKQGMRDLLESFWNSGIPMVIASTGNKELIEIAFARLGIESYFEEILTATEYHTTKKCGDLYEIGAEKMGTNPGETAVFEDVLFALESAKKAGFLTIAVEDFSSKEDQREIIEMADYYLREGEVSSFLQWIE
ncbi:HAD family phosphatase [Peptoniphilus sp. KCTC 25270]|uniref:HAD family hydrolase n=1 Tax=Peptoniphilus sp. KCTC 25270 TaxID=2897414 RepID=UPI001E454B32|nr:HAD family phosphatase [Peptoniphilus sp. KCTC 25270]MCD1147241.1 HAD family phosphatase [Peptoniphilus sp. KCTC 25270]